MPNTTPMNSAQCAAKAVECLEAAVNAKSEPHKELLRKIAASWQSMADDLAKLENR